ncbi:50S ribosomal protein L31 [endosymbiont GvMRE of Glomus versiforme]|uniref:50S ribosomal protein L31 n=1 Tax=endosymbiont GvMRE of Glomus versiforme TaxID=2039283 RepID=UPI000ECC7D9C|nr:50S ribosomal protein L31 [endosymbiont GvMRE of Glomus versiforme]RHZ36403.1 50S ribosomal protein L31 [endosymbiont GvMRE of Glomus versiforme]
MKKNLHSPLYLINYHCISCQTEYQNWSTSQKNKEIATCAECNPAYKGESLAKIRVGRAEKFHQRQKKAQEKAAAKAK